MVNLANRQHIRNWFALGCGLFGIWELLRAVDYAMGAFDIITGWYRPPIGTTFAGAVLQILGHFFLALWLLGSATKLAAFWYPDTANDNVSDKNDSDSKTTTT